MSSDTVPVQLRLVTQIAADRAVSTTSVRFVQGMLPEIERKLSVEDRTDAYINREQSAEHTSLSATHILPEYYPRQLAEVGVVQLSRKGEYGMVETSDGQWRGKSSGWVADQDAYTPKDIPALDLEAEDYVLDVDQQAAVACLAPTTTDWAKNPEAHRLVLALIHHTGLRRVKLTAKQAGQILGKTACTGWRVLRRLEQLGMYVKGWVDYAQLLVDAGAALVEKDHAAKVATGKLVRWSVFTKEGWAHRDTAKQWRDMLPTLGEVREEYRDGVGGTFVRALKYVRDVLAQPYSTGRPVEI